MSREPLTRAPLVEYVFEVHWANTLDVQGWSALYEEYELTLGRLYDRLKQSGYPIPIRLASLPREAFITFARNDFITHRFLKSTAQTVGQLTYPLIQFGPGVGTLNVDGPNYKWGEFREQISIYFALLVDLHQEFMGKIQSISLKSIDFFECSDLGRFFDECLHISQQSSLKDLPQVKEGIEVPSFQTMIKLKEYDSTVTVRAMGGKVADKDGLMLEITANSLHPSILEDGFSGLIDYLHGVAGDAFFALVKKDELNARK